MDISSTVWQGDDYIPRVWDTWIEEDDRLGFLITGEVGGRVVAVQHTSLQPESVAWMEGIRVHPDYRNRGIGNRMLDYALRQARDRACTRARLSTAQVNVASSTIATSREFREIAQFGIYSAPAHGGDPLAAGTVEAGPADLRLARAMSGADETLLADGWTAWDVPGQRTVESFEIKWARKAHDVIDGVVLASESYGRNRLSIAYLGGTRNAIRELGLAMRTGAAVRGLESAVGTLRRSPDLDAGLAAAGYARNEELVMLVFERPL